MAKAQKKSKAAESPYGRERAGKQDFGQRLENALRQWGLVLQERVSKGYSSEVYRVQKASGGALLALKIERSKSPRRGMAEKEAKSLRIANSLGIGPRLVAHSAENRAVLMEFIPGMRFSDFIFSKPAPAREALMAVLRSLFAQARALDIAGLDHGQVAGRGANIIIRETGQGSAHGAKAGGRLQPKGRGRHAGKPAGITPGMHEPVIIDFEKASTSRRCHNATRLAALVALNPRSKLTRRIREILAPGQKAAIS